MKFKSIIYFSFWQLLNLCLFTQLAAANVTPNVWDVLRGELVMNHEITEPAVQNQIRWIIAHPSYLQKLAQAKPYIYHIVSEIRKRHLPGELALIPMIESAYDPFAYSGVGAAGLWQFMPGTGNDLGLKQDWWFDARRSIGASTEAALNYLTYLNKFFNGSWILAIAAYDSGEGTVLKAIKNSGQPLNKINFWTLPVPNETKAYVPRLLALAEIITYPDRYKIILPDIPHIPYFTEVNIGSQIDLNRAAKLAGITYKDLLQLNPGYNRWTTAPNQPFKLLIPAEKAAKFNLNLASLPVAQRVSWTRYQVRHGDSLNTIATRYFTTVKLLREINQLSSEAVHAGQSILIPCTKNIFIAAKSPQSAVKPTDKPPSFQLYKVIHIAQAGEKFTSLEKKYHITTADIQYWNKIDASQPLVKGTQLVIWKKVVKPGIYTINAGDSLISIAKKYNTTITSLVKLNPKLNINSLAPGQQLLIG